MNMYNMLFGRNPQAPILKALLNLDGEDKKFPTGRFRDIYIEDKFIVLHTRNGGGNREYCWGEDDKDFDETKRCTCPACCINKVLPTHPLYHHDEDDDFDRTYNNCYFKKPEAAKDWEDMWKKPSDKWKDLFDEMKGKKDPTEEGKRAMEVGKKLISEIMDKVKKDEP